MTVVINWNGSSLTYKEKLLLHKDREALKEAAYWNCVSFVECFQDLPEHPGLLLQLSLFGWTTDLLRSLSAWLSQKIYDIAVRG